MSTKYYCDGCDKEVVAPEGRRIRRKLGRIVVEVITGLDGTWNSGVFCRQCVLAAVNYGESVEPA